MSARRAVGGGSESTRHCLPPLPWARAGGPDPAGRSPVWSGAAALAVALVVGLRLVYGLAAALFATGKLHPENLLPSAPLSASLLISPWQRFDAFWFQSIAVHGYAAKPGATAFLPLYPLLEGVAGHLVGGAPLGGLLVSTAALIAALILMARFAEPIIGRRAARYTMVLLTVAPTAVFLFAGYTESLFLLLALAVFLLARGGRLGWAGLTAGIAVLTRDQGLFLAPALLAGLWFGPARPRGAGAWAAAVLRICGPSVIAGGAIAAAWEWMGQGLGPWTQEALWGARASPPWSTIADSVRVIFQGGHAEELLNLVAVAAMVVTLPWVWRRLGAAPGAFQLLSLAVIVVHENNISPLTSADRYILALPGVFIAVAAILDRRPSPLRWSVAALSFAAAVYVLGRFVAFHFVG